MAEKRMFTTKIVDSDIFKEMPLSAQALYFHLGMNADDEGFLNNAKSVQRSIAASDDDMKLLIAKKFIIPFQSGIVVIKHWKMHNSIQPSRIKPTPYTEEKKLLYLKENKSYTLNPANADKLLTDCQQNDDNSCQNTAEIRLDKIRLDKDSIDKNICPSDTAKKRFVKPTLQEVEQYCADRNNGVDFQKWYSHYESNGWKVGKNPMKDWKAAVRTWERTNYKGDSDAVDKTDSKGSERKLGVYL